MAIQSFVGRPAMLGPSPFVLSSLGIVESGDTINAANCASISIGRVRTSDGASHTIDTTGSSAIMWRSGSVTFANAGSTLNVGIAPVDSANGPPARATNSAGTISFDVSASLTGGATLPSNSTIATVPTAGSKTIANGDLVAVAIQLTTRGGSDVINVNWLSSGNASQFSQPAVTYFSSSIYSRRIGAPNILVVFNDGAFGWIEGGDIYSSVTTRTFNSGSSPNEYGMLYQFPFPMRISGAYGILGQSSNAANCDIVLYSDPLGTPVAQKTLSIDAHTIALTGNSFFSASFTSSYDLPRNTPIGVIFKPSSGTNVSAWLKTMSDAAHRIADVGGITSYGIRRSGGSGAFANANSSLDLYYIGLLASGFDNGSGGGGVSRARAFGGV